MIDGNGPQPRNVPLHHRILALKAGTEREERYRELAYCVAMVMLTCADWFRVNKLPFPGVIGPQLDEWSQKTAMVMEKLERGAIIYQPDFSPSFEEGPEGKV